MFQKIKGYFELKKSNYGQNYGWFIEYEKEIIGELIDLKIENSPWCSYEIVCYKKENEKILYENFFWEKEFPFKFKNKKLLKYSDYPLTSLPYKINDKYRVNVRCLVIKE